MSNLSHSIDRLTNSWQVLQHRWQQTRVLWNDPVAWAFEKDLWAPLEAQVHETVREIERLAQVVSQAQRQVK